MKYGSTLMLVVALMIPLTHEAYSSDKPSEVVSIKLVVPAKTAALSRDGTKTACVGDDGILRIFDASNGREVARSSETLSHATSIEFSQDGEWVATGGALRTVRSDRTQPEFSAGSGADMRANGRGMLPEEDVKELKLAVVRPPITDLTARFTLQGGCVGIWESSNGRLVHKFDGYNYPVTAVSFDRDKENLVIVDTKFNVIRKSIQSGVTSCHYNNHTIRSIKYPCPQTRFSSDGQIVASVAAEESSLQIRVKISDGRGPRFWILGPEDTINVPWSIALSPDGRRLFLGGPSGRLDIWDLTSRRLTGTIEMKDGEKSEIGFIAIHPDGLRALVGELQGRITLWDVPSKRQVYCVDGPRRDFRAVSFREGRFSILSGGFRRIDGKVDPLLVQTFDTAIKAGP